MYSLGISTKWFEISAMASVQHEQTERMKKLNSSCQYIEEYNII